MVEVEGGAFMMGLNGINKDEKPAHEVKLNSFLAAEFPVTQDLYEFATGRNPSRFLGKRRPVEKVSWYDAVEFCNQLSQLAGLDLCYHIDREAKDPNNQNEDKYDDKKWLVRFNHTANGYRLPTEAEWEYAARGGKHWEGGFEYAGGNDLKDVGWYYENSHEETMPVGLKQPNQLGLYDMSGNVREWCWDWYDSAYYEKSLNKNPQGPQKGLYRVDRGGCWDGSAGGCRVAYRSFGTPAASDGDLGLRLARQL